MAAENVLLKVYYTGVKLFVGSKVPCMFCFEICIAEGEGEKREGMLISKQTTRAVEIMRHVISDLDLAI